MRGGDEESSERKKSEDTSEHDEEQSCESLTRAGERMREVGGRTCCSSSNPPVFYTWRARTPSDRLRPSQQDALNFRHKNYQPVNLCAVKTTTTIQPSGRAFRDTIPVLDRVAGSGPGTARECVRVHKLCYVGCQHDPTGWSENRYFVDPLGTRSESPRKKIEATDTNMRYLRRPQSAHHDRAFGKDSRQRPIFKGLTVVALRMRSKL